MNKMNKMKKKCERTNILHCDVVNESRMKRHFNIHSIHLSIFVVKRLKFDKIIKALSDAEFLSVD